MASMAQKSNLLSLPDDVLASVALKMCCWQPASEPWESAPEPLKDWGKAALTCKRLWEVQLPFDPPTIRKWEDLKWHLKHFKGAKAIRIHIKEWPWAWSAASNDKILKELADSLLEVSCNLRQMKRLEIWPSRIPQQTDWRCPRVKPSKDPWERTYRCLQPLSPWMTAMLTGASSLSHVRLGVEMLPCLPMSGRRTLKSLHIDAKDKWAVRHAVQAVMDYEQLRSLTIVCLNEGTCGSPHVSPRRDSCRPELDLRHLVHLRNCHLKYLPALHGIVLSQGELELTIILEHIAGWSKLWHQIQPDVRSITVERCPDSWLFSLSDWPQGIEAFHGLQFLQLNCGEGQKVGEDWDFDRDALDLAHVAYIPHVSLWCKTSMDLKISKGTWKVLEVYCAGYFEIRIGNAKAFVEGTNTFSFTFNSALRRDPEQEVTKFSEELKEAGAEVGKPLYEYYHVDSPLESAHFNSPLIGMSSVNFGDAPWMELRNCQREGSVVDSVFSKARLEYLIGS